MALLPGLYDAVQGAQSRRLAELLRKSPLSALELHHPWVLRRISLLWGTPEMETFFLRVTTDAEFAGTTFNPSELEELGSLNQVHRMRQKLLEEEQRRL